MLVSSLSVALNWAEMLVPFNVIAVVPFVMLKLTVLRLMLSFAVQQAGRIRQVKFIPQVRVNGDLNICVDAAALYENIPVCS